MSRPIKCKSLGPSDLLAVRAVFLLVAALALATLAGPSQGPRAEAEHQAARSLALWRGWAIDPGTPEGGALVAGRGLAPGAAAGALRAGPEGRWYPAAGPLGAALAAPLWWLGNGVGRLGPAIEERFQAAAEEEGRPQEGYAAKLATGARDALLLALVAALVTASAMRVGAGRGAAFAAGLLLVVATFAWPASRGGQDGLVAAGVVMAALYQWLRVRGEFALLERPERRDLLLLGAALGAAPLAETALWVFALTLALGGAVTLARGHRSLRRQPLLRKRSGRWAAARDGCYLTVPLAAGLVAWWAWSLASAAGEGGLSAGELLAGLSWRPLALEAATLTASPGSGLLWMAPLVLLAPCGLWLLRGDRALMLALLAAAATAALAALEPGRGLEGYGPVVLLAALAVLWVPVAVALGHLQGPRGRRLLVAPLALAGTAAALGGVLVDSRTHRELLWQHLAGKGAAQTLEQRGSAGFAPLPPWPAEWRWEWTTAAPWAHWRILRHRVAGLGERFPAERIFLAPRAQSFEPWSPEARGFRHLAWVDFAERLGGHTGGLLLALGLLLGGGLVAAARALDPAAP